MQAAIVWLIIGASIAGLLAIGWVGDRISKWNDIRLGEKRRAKLYDERIVELNSLEERKKELDNREQKLGRWQQEILAIAEEKTKGFPWLAQAFGDYFYLENLKESNSLRYKKHPAPKAADRVRQIGADRREVERDMRVARYLLAYYESLFPWLSEFRGEDVDDLIQSTASTPADDGDDAARHWLTAAEYEKLASTEKYQLALDRYWTRKKSRWEIGRDYERFVGYLYETKGGAVQYQGIVKGFEDLGRDLIVQNEDYIEVVQCKNWSQSKTIHEKHIFQLYGTVVAFQVDNPGKQVRGRFVTSTRLSETAKKFAALLNIEYAENFALREYPCIKCNVSRRDGERIYHLPFDQQYDSTIIEHERLERYVQTVAEAEALGFRRAHRWRGIAARGAP